MVRGSRYWVMASPIHLSQYMFWDVAGPQPHPRVWTEQVLAKRLKLATGQWQRSLDHKAASAHGLWCGELFQCIGSDRCEWTVLEAGFLLAAAACTLLNTQDLKNEQRDAVKQQQQTGIFILFSFSTPALSGGGTFALLSVGEWPINTSPLGAAKAFISCQSQQNHFSNGVC